MRRPTTPVTAARLCGWLYLFIILSGLFAEIFVRGRIIVSGDASATAANILAHETLFRAGTVAEILAFCCDVAVAVLLYKIFKPVNPTLALLAALFRVVTDGITAVGDLGLFGAVLILRGASNIKDFTPQQLADLAFTAVRLHGNAYGTGLIFFGISLPILGYLIFKSSLLPKTIGVMLGIAGPCYLINSVALLAAPKFADTTFLLLLIPFVAESALCGWLIFKGANVERRAQLGASG